MMLAVHPMVERLWPEIILVAGGSLILLLGLSRSLSRGIVGVALAVVMLALLTGWRSADAGSDPFVVASLNNGPLVGYARLVTLAIGLLILLLNRHVPEEAERGEFFALILFSLCGVTLVAIANNLILLFLALELVSVPTYILIGLSRRDIRAQEATGKYFFLGAFAAAMTLYGFSFLYGAAGTMTMFGREASIASALSAAAGAGRDPLVLVGLMLALGGLAFKVAAVPFHFYVADVYQGAASPVTGMLGFVPKFAGFLAMIQLLALAHWRYGDAVFWLLWALAAATMTVGNTLALMQHNVKRMLAYSSIAHSGYMLVGLVAGPGIFARDASATSDGLAAILFYMTLYGVMNLGAFAALSFFRQLGHEQESVETLDELAGSARRHPWASLAMVVCVLGLMGFPLTGGFLGKFYLFTAALSASYETNAVAATIASSRSLGMIILVVIAVLNAAIGAAYYLRILASCYLRQPAPGIVASECRALRISLGLCAAIVLAVFIRPGVLFEASRDAVRQIPHAVRAQLEVSPPENHLLSASGVDRRSED